MTIYLISVHLISYTNVCIYFSFTWAVMLNFVHVSEKCVFSCKCGVFSSVYIVCIPIFFWAACQKPLTSLVALWIYRLSQISFEHCVVQQTLCENEFKNRSFFNRLLCWKSIGCVENFTHVEYAGNVDAQHFFLVNVCKYKCFGIH